MKVVDWWRGVGAWAREAHILFWLVLIVLVPAVGAAATVDAQAPAWALRSVAVYRLEVGLAVFLAGYILALTVCLSYQGRSLGKLGIAGSEMDPKDPSPLEQAAEGAEDFQTEARENFDDFLDLIVALDTRVTALEDASPHDPEDGE